MLGRARSAIQALVDAKQAQLVACQIAEKVDAYCLLRNEGLPLEPEWAEIESSTVWWAVVDPLHAEQRKCRGSMERSPIIDCDVELTVYMDPVSGVLLGYPQEERVGAYDHLLTLAGVREFGYWNNTDQPEGVSDEEWERRAKLWNQVLDEPDIARLSLRWEPRFEEREAVLAALPTLEQRVARKAKNRVLHQQIQAHYKAHPEDARRASLAGVSRVIRLTEQAMASEGSDLHQQLVAAQAEIAPLLVAELGKHMFSSFKELPGATT